jgi:hypothetical protein
LFTTWISLLQKALPNQPKTFLLQGPLRKQMQREQELLRRVIVLAVLLVLLYARVKAPPAWTGRLKPNRPPSSNEEAAQGKLQGMQLVQVRVKQEQHLQLPLLRIAAS